MALTFAGYTSAYADPVAPDGGVTDFASSFEPTDPQPVAPDTVDTDASGAPRASGVNGTDALSIPGNVTDKVVQVQASAENTGGGEVATNLADSNPFTKWLTFNPTGWAGYTLSAPTLVTKYALTSANDAPERDPKNWTFQGSQDGVNWSTLDTQTGQTFTDRYQTKLYPISNTTAYKYYKLDITLNNGGPLLQLADLQIANDNVPPPAPNMRSFVGRGPNGAYNSRAYTGWTGLHAFRYLGTQTVNGHGYSYNRVYDVNLPVTPQSELSYQIFPDYVRDDLENPSTYASVDLAFSDGTYLSQLGALDQHGFPLSPQGQGDSKSLYTNQWNHISSTIGAVAAGKVITKILVGYDNPNGPHSFGGWLDDLKITGTPPPVAAPISYADRVLTTRGTNAGSGFSRGNNFPATAVPHGFNFWSPMTNAGSQSWFYEYAKRNNADNLPTIQSFTASHEPSPWMGDRQTFQVMPSVGAPTADWAARALPFKHENEIARPHYYGVTFENGMKTEIAPTDHAAMFRFTFNGNSGNVQFDNINNSGGLTLDPANGVVSGYSDVVSWGTNGASRLYVYGVVDQPVTGSGMLTGAGRDNVAGYLTFGTKTVDLRIATSLIGVEQAKANLNQEIAPTEPFESVKDRAQRQWDAQLHVIDVEGATPDQQTTLYSNLYRLFLYPNSGYENTGSTEQPVYRYASPVAPPTGTSTPTQTGAKIVDGKIYVNNGFWDTYRSAWPAYSLLTPAKAGEMIDGFVRQYKDGGWVARWSSPGYANLMTGTSSDVAFADALNKGVTNFDVQAAYDAAVKNATVASPDDRVGRKGLDTSIFKGYTSTATDQGMSWGIEGYLNDFGIANMSKTLLDKAKPDDPRRKEYQDNYEYFRNRALDYVKTFDPAVGFFQGRNPDGSFRLPAGSYDPRVWGYDYTETDGWNYAFSVPQDGQGLANLYGGKDKLAQKLDQFFATPETAKFPGSYGGVIHEMTEARDVRMGQYGGSNEPSLHIPYMYDYAGQPWKAQAKEREALSRLSLGSENGQGYVGDEDNGEMSAWQVFSALGFYPLQAGSPNYAIGSPLFTKATIHLENGHDLVINAPNNNARNVYVQGLTVNGQPWNKTSLPHDVLAAGGTLDFDMGPNPSNWGADGPPDSMTTGDAVATPERDVAAGWKIDAGAGIDPAPLTDKTSATSVTFPNLPTLNFQANGDPEKVAQYTLTSGAAPGSGDPRDWVLQGSYDGKTWQTVDQRAGETFPNRQQTRAFSVADPGRYAFYRLRVTANSGPSSTALAEVELLATPPAACSQTITGAHSGDVHVTSGVLCVTNAHLTGRLTVDSGAAVRVVGSTVDGALQATGASSVVLVGATMNGGVNLTGTTGEVSLEHSTVTGPVSVANGTGGTVLAANTVNGSLSCSGNNPAPVNNGFPNAVTGPRQGQAVGL